MPEVLEGVDRAGLAVGERPPVAGLRQRVADPARHGVGRGQRVDRRVDGARLVDVRRGEVEVRVAEDQVGQRARGLGAEVADRLQVRLAEEPALDPPDVRREVGDDRRERLDRQDRAGLLGDAVVVRQLVPEVPGEDRARAPPALHGEGDPRLHRGQAVGVRQQVDPIPAGAPAFGVVGVVLPHDPGEEGVEGRQQQPQAMPLAERHQVVDGPDGDRVVAPAGALQVEAVADIFEHQAERRDAVGLQPGEVPVDGRQVAAIEQPFQLGPGQGVVLTDDQERLPLLGLEVAAARAEPDPREGPPEGLRPGRRLLGFAGPQERRRPVGIHPIRAPRVLRVEARARPGPHPATFGHPVEAGVAGSLGSPDSA